MGLNDLTPGNTILGATDETDIGNIGDALKVSFPATSFDQQGRLRTSEHRTLFEATGLSPLDTVRYWSTGTSGGGSIAAAANGEPAQVLSVGTTSGDFAKLQSKRKIEYNKGHSQLILLTGNFNAPKANLVQRYGYFCDTHGLFFQANGTTFQIVRRESVSTGSVQNHVVNQSSWNVDTLDGNGPSGLTLDLDDTSTIFAIDFLWLGVKSARFYIGIGEKLIHVHTLEFSNLLSTAFMDSGMCPITMEIENTGTTASASQMKMICNSVKTEGGDVTLGSIKNVSTGAASVAISTTPTIVAGIRINSSYNNASIKPLDFRLLPQTGNDFAFYQVIFNPTLTGATWAANSEGIADVLTNSPTFSGGSVLRSGYIQLGNKNQSLTNISSEVNSDIFLGNDDFGEQTAVILVIQTTAGSGDIFFSGSFQEFR